MRNLQSFLYPIRWNIWFLKWSLAAAPLLHMHALQWVEPGHAGLPGPSVPPAVEAATISELGRAAARPLQTEGTSALACIQRRPSVTYTPVKVSTAYAMQKMYLNDPAARIQEECGSTAFESKRLKTNARDSFQLRYTEVCFYMTECEEDKGIWVNWKAVNALKNFCKFISFKSIKFFSETAHILFKIHLYCQVK